MSNGTQRYLVTVCQHRSCLRSGADHVLKRFQEHQSDEVMISGSECQGQCGSGPTVRVLPGNIWYCQVTSEDVDIIVNEHFAGGKPVAKLLNTRIHRPKSAYTALADQYQSFIQEG